MQLIWRHFVVYVGVLVEWLIQVLIAGYPISCDLKYTPISGFRIRFILYLLIDSFAMALPMVQFPLIFTFGLLFIWASIFN